MCAGMLALTAVLMAQLLQVSVASALRKKGQQGESNALLSNGHHGGSAPYATTSLDGAEKAQAAIGHDHSHDHADAHSHSLLFDEKVEKHVATYVLELGIASHRSVSITSYQVCVL